MARAAGGRRAEARAVFAAMIETLPPAAQRYFGFSIPKAHHSLRSRSSDSGRDQPLGETAAVLHAGDERLLPLTLASNRFLLHCSNRTPPSPVTTLPACFRVRPTKAPA